MKVASITTCDINNGPGVRCTVWISGCSRKCKGCHNSELADYNFGKYEILSEEVFEKLSEELNKKHITGITFSGGDPLDHSKKELRKLRTVIDWIKMHYPSKSIWIYTGALFEDLLNDALIVSILTSVDVIVDGQFELEKRDITLPFRGSGNQRIIDVQKTLASNQVVTISDEEFKK